MLKLIKEAERHVFFFFFSEAGFWASGCVALYCCYSVLGCGFLVFEV